jgi:hypothetical protein
MSFEKKIEFSEKYEDYVINQRDVDLYLKKKKISSLFGSVAHLAGSVSTVTGIMFVVFGVTALVEYASLILPISTIELIESSNTNTVVGSFSLFAIAVGVFVILEYISVRFEEGANSVGVTNESLVLHYLARAVEAGKRDEPDIEKFSEHIEKIVDKGDFSDRTTQRIRKYQKRIEDDPDYFRETLDFFANLVAEIAQDKPDQNLLLLQYLANPNEKPMTEGGFDGDKANDQSASYVDAITEELPTSGIKTIGNRFWLLYLTAAVLGVASIYLITPTIGTAILLILLTGLQILHGQGKEEN